MSPEDNKLQIIWEDMYMYDVCDVVNASYCSADVVNHVLCEYGDGSMGNGIRKFAGEMLMVGGRKSFDFGYEAGCADTYPVAFQKGIVTGTIIGICVTGMVCLGVWCTERVIAYRRANKNTGTQIMENSEEEEYA